LAETGREFLFDDDTFADDHDTADYYAIDDFDADDQAGAALADQILRLLGSHPIDLDEIARQCGAGPAEFSLAVLELDLAGLIDLLPGGMIVRAEPGG
jgi:predicted Rossmann fold nucleotide-binding protein DprA/Smf involved in DNA uptake